MTDGGDSDEPPTSPGRALIVLLILAIVAALALFLVRGLQESARMQDCLASGRTNCAPIGTPAR